MDMRLGYRASYMYVSLSAKKIIDQEPSAEEWAADPEGPEPSPQSLPKSESSGSLEAARCRLRIEYI